MLPGLEWIGNLGNSSFFTTVFGALAGAFAGAWAAQRIAERSKLREEWQKEIRNTNTGIVLTSATCNLAYALKKQYIKALKESYDAECRSMHEHKQKQEQMRAAGAPVDPFNFAPNLNSLHEISPPLDYLQDIVGRLSSSGRALAAVTAAADATRNLNNALNKRNDILERMKDERLPKGAEVYHFYFGIPYAEGRGNNEYGSYVRAMASYTDDALFFSTKLHDDLYEHGKAISEKYRRKFGGDAPDISYIDWEKADKEGLLPKDEEYSDWLSGYVTLPMNKPRWWQRKDRSAQAAE